MKSKFTPLVDEHLQSLLGMREEETDNCFYTRLKSRMLAGHIGGENNLPLQGWGLPLKPVWIIGALALLLFVNGMMVTQLFTSKKPTATVSATDLQNFAEWYDQSISSPF
ncbi:hypothetical protein [Ferruginibacter sp.]|uniref:hypothetical protein n=1 Tax=Ferruginibacter sp. TaxID=1940288 RepID=UPI002659B412|nr:hypothetical protein [Ferruginibacter sp.]